MSAWPVGGILDTTTAVLGYSYLPLTISVGRVNDLMAVTIRMQQLPHETRPSAATPTHQFYLSNVEVENGGHFDP